MNEHLSLEQVEAAERAVEGAMYEYGPDGHTDGAEIITRAALEAAGLTYPSSLDGRGVPDPRLSTSYYYEHLAKGRTRADGVD